MAEEQQTFTMDETPADQPEFTEEEMDSLKVGEKMVEQDEQLLAGKYKNSEELEKAYIELQKKIGEPKDEESNVSEESKSEEVSDDKQKEDETKEETESEVLNRLWDSREKGFDDELLKELASTNPGELAKEYLKYRQQSDVQPELTESDIKDLKGLVGTEEDYQAIISWAETGVSQEEQDMFDNVIDSGNKEAAYFAVQAMLAKYRDAVGSDGDLITGKPPSNNSAGFRSQAEVVKAMSDSRYELDPAYREDIKRKLENSNIDF
jgi:hypothetical protein